MSSLTVPEWAVEALTDPAFEEYDSDRPEPLWSHVLWWTSQDERDTLPVRELVGLTLNRQGWFNLYCSFPHCQHQGWTKVNDDTTDWRCVDHQ